MVTEILCAFACASCVFGAEEPVNRLLELEVLTGATFLRALLAKLGMFPVKQCDEVCRSARPGWHQSLWSVGRAGSEAGDLQVVWPLFFCEIKACTKAAQLTWREGTRVQGEMLGPGE